MSKSGVKCDNKDMHKRANYLFQVSKGKGKKIKKNVMMFCYFILEECRFLSGFGVDIDISRSS